jgi:hypothetical protein
MPLVGAVTKYTRRDFGRDLEMQLLTHPQTLRLSQWAYRVYLDHVHNLEPGLKDTIMAVVLMEEGPEFAVSKAELRCLAERLQAQSGDG